MRPLLSFGKYPFTGFGIFRGYHLSSPLQKWPNELREFIKEERSAHRRVKIWAGMSIWDLAVSLRKDVDYVNEVLKPSFSADMDRVTGSITNLSSIKNFLRNGNVSFTVINDSIKKDNIKNIPLNNEKSTTMKIDIPNTNAVKRPPIVTIMGHVDHGKTTLLDALRNSNIVANEFGGITQHIGAFSVTLTQDSTVTFIDTPGHAAFSSMRNRGAEITDIVVLIVAADDGVMEQTVESINMAKNVGVRIIVAVNKIDKVGNSMETIQQRLLQEGIQAEALGGDVQFVPISALKRINLDLLIDTILLEAEMMTLTGDPKGPVEAVVVESSLGKKGKIATVIVKRGTIRKKALLIAGKALCRVRAMFDEYDRELTEVTLSRPAQIIGWKDLPNAGEKVFEVSSMKEANSAIVEEKKKIQRQKLLEDYSAIRDKYVQEKADLINRKLEALRLKQAKDISGLKEFYARKQSVKLDSSPRLNCIVKGDVNGSVDAILDILDTYDAAHECKLDLIHYGIGEITPSDLDLAKCFKAVIYCFNLKYPHKLKTEIISSGIVIKFFNVIYALIHDIREELSARKMPVEEEEITGTGEVIQHFTITEGKKKVAIAGSVCHTGEFTRINDFRVIRKNIVVFEGKIRSLKHFKNEVNSVKINTQCGIMFQDFEGEFQPGDKIICFHKKLVNYPISWDPGF